VTRIGARKIDLFLAEWIKPRAETCRSNRRKGQCICHAVGGDRCLDAPEGNSALPQIVHAEQDALAGIFGLLLDEMQRAENLPYPAAPRLWALAR